MEKINTNSLKIGMRFSKPVFFDDLKNVFLPENEPVADFHLNSIRNWNIQFLYTAGKQLLQGEVFVKSNEIELLEEIGNFGEIEKPSEENSISASLVPANPNMAENTENPLYKEYAFLVQNLHDILLKIKTRNGDGLNAELEKISAGVFAFSAKGAQAVQCMLTYDFHEEHAAVSAVDCAVLTAIISQALKTPEQLCEYYVMGALLHDIGMLWQPDSITKKQGALLPEEFTRLKSHTIDGSRYIVDSLSLPREVALVVLQHHERWDGQGYPAGKAGLTIDSGALIVSVVDSFEAMVSTKAYRNSLIAYEALKNIINESGKRFCPDVVKAFVICMGVFPYGSYVLLSNSAIARVIATKPTSPLRPTVQILADSAGNVFKNNTGEEIDLETNKSLFIAKVLEPKNVAHLK